ncbi:MAG: RNA polymerase sigma-70 factor [Bacteroidota bacterium]
MGRRTAKILNFKKSAEKDLQDYFERIYKEYFKRLYAYALTITKSKILAQEIVSDVFFNLWSSRESLYDIKELKSYLFTSVKNRSISALADNPLIFQKEDHDELISYFHQVDPEELMIGNELIEFLNHSIENLPPQCQLVFNMIKGQNLSYRDVAIELGISTETVKYHLRVALVKLKKDLGVFFAEARVINLHAR